MAQICTYCSFEPQHLLITPALGANQVKFSTEESLTMYWILKLGIRPQTTSKPDSDVAQDMLKQIEIIHEDVRRNMMHVPILNTKLITTKELMHQCLKEKEYVYILQPKANNQGKQNHRAHGVSMGWSLHIVERVLPNNTVCG